MFSGKVMSADYLSADTHPLFASSRAVILIVWFADFKKLDCYFCSFYCVFLVKRRVCRYKILHKKDSFVFTRLNDFRKN